MNVCPLLLALLPTTPAQPGAPAILPKPVHLAVGAGSPFEITRNTVLVAPSDLEGARLLQTMLATGAGLHLPTAHRTNSHGWIRFQKAPAGTIKAEGYTLHVTHDGIAVHYADQGGSVNAVETLRQLLPPAIEASHPSGTSHWTVPAVDVEDAPRFPWRGMHLDVSRHFFPAAFIKKYIDYLALMKMNVFHWHLVDDGGWRLQIDKYPKLTEVGAWRYGITTDWDQSRLRFDPSSGLPKYGGFYTKAEVRDIVKYAAARNVTIVPEIEMPGHAMPVFAAYPELGCKNQPKADLTGQPDTNVYCAGSESTYRFIENVLDEVMALFPSKWIHIGGDEVDKRFWKACPVCQDRIKNEGLKNEEELQSYFVRRIDKYLASKGRRLIGWDEILEGGLAKGATVMSWRGIDGGIAAAKAGHDVVMSPTSHAYFDASNTSQTTEHVYTFDPVPPALNATEAKHVLGGQANVWTEWIPTTQRVEYMIFPRIAAMSEVLWSPKDGRDVNEFLSRLSSIYERLDRLGANYYLPAPRVKTNALLFIDHAQVSVIEEKKMPGSIRYTLDGSAPTAKSKLYAGPITIDRKGTVTFAFVNQAGHAGSTTTVECAPSDPGVPSNLIRGWNVAYYEGSWTQTPDYSKLTPIKEAVSTTVDLAQRAREDNFALHFAGYFKAGTEGLYRFALTSDDGSWLKIGGLSVVNNDGTHPPTTREGSIWLPRGFFPIEVGYFQAAEAKSLSLSVQAPGANSIGPADPFILHAGS